MNETQRNIKAYKAALPELKEKVVAVALLLLMSAAMMTSATFAWITLSRAPEVSNVSTTVAANGNLEIALVQPNGDQPPESAVGDSSAAPGNTVVNANLTWGNLVNLSDESYGLNNIVLRPALLGNVNDLLSQPLKGVDYGEDGRLQQYYNEDYRFTNWTKNANGEGGYFKYNDTPQYGVRAISTVEYTYVNNTLYQFDQLMNTAVGIRQVVEEAYSGAKGITQNDEYIDALAAMIGTYMTDNLNDSNSDMSAYIKPLYKLMRDVYELMVGSEDLQYCFEDAMAALANTQVYMKHRDDYLSHTYTGTTLLQASASELSANGVNAKCLDQYRTMKSNIYKVLYGADPEKDDCIYDYFKKAYPYINEQTGEPDEDRRDTSVKIYMNDLFPYINKMVQVDTCELILADGTSYKVSGIGVRVAMDLLLNGKLNNCSARINHGYLVDFEKITGANMDAQGVTVTVKYIMTVPITAQHITTVAVPGQSSYENDVVNIRDEAAGDKGDYTAVAQDTYGMALDFWVRTNAHNSYLVLEGNVLTETTTVRDTGIDSEGNEVELYTATITNKVVNDGEEESFSEDVAVYQLPDEDGNPVWYRASNHSLLYDYDENGNLPEGQTISTPRERYKDVSTVIGYEGENRIWDEEALMDTSSTTQGNGSCYVFYAEDPTQQTNSLRLLSNLRVAFIDSDPISNTCGKMVAVGKLDVDNRYEENGKVTIPLKLFNDSSTYLTTYEEGLAVIPLERGKAHRLTVVIYLDGREISNADVLAANEIHGQLNIQFGNTKQMDAIRNEELELATRSVSAVIKTEGKDYPDTNNGPRYDEETGVLTSDPDVTFTFEDATVDNPMKVKVQVKIDGERATKVEAFFMRKVSATQGSREGVFKLTESASKPGVYEGEYEFTAPGEYVLRTVQLDGVDYDLPADNYPIVFIDGFSVTNVSMFRNGQEVTNSLTTIMTDKRNVTADLVIQFASSKKMPSDVKLQFRRDDDAQITVNMIPDTGGWKGTANFTSSGEYTLVYMILDGEYTELDPKYQKILDISMGLTVKVIDGGDYRNFTYEPGVSVTVPMFVEIYDDNDEEIRYLQGVQLYYSNSGSPIAGSNPDVKWSTSDDCYVGNVLIPGPGVYTFNSVVVGANTLSSTINIPPTFTCMSPNPPSYVDNQPMANMDYLLSTGGETHSVGIRLAEAQGATVIGVLENSDLLTNKTREVMGKRSIDELTGYTTFYFEIPKETGTGFQSGNWTIKSLKLANVYGEVIGEDGEPALKHFTESDPMLMDLSGTNDDLHVKIVNVVADVVEKDNDETLNGGQFMGSATAQNPIKVKITDQKGEPLNSEYVSISDLNIRYLYKSGTSQAHGGYSTQVEPSIEVNITSASNDGTTFTMNLPTFSYAGEFEAYALTFNVSDKKGITKGDTFNYTSEELQSSNTSNVDGILKLPVYILKTAAPTVTIDSISPSGDHQSMAVSGRDSRLVSVTSSAVGNTVTIYAGMTSAGSTIGTTPSVTLRINNLGNASANLKFTASGGGTVHMYTGTSMSGRTDTYSWTSASPTYSLYIGQYKSGRTCSNMTYEGAGTLTSNSYITVTYNDVTYTVAVDPITIINNNPPY